MATKPKTTLAKSEPKQQLDIAPFSPRELTPGIWNMIEKLAPTMYRAHMFGVQSPEQAAAIMLKGYELGLSITASFEFIQVIDSKPTLSPRGAMSLLFSSPVTKEIKVNRLVDAKGIFLGYECTMTRTNGFSHTSKFTLEDAKRAGLTAGSDMGNGKIRQGYGNWEKYPENMCLWRAVGFAADIVFPDVVAGMTTLMKAPEMYGVALTEGGDVIDVAPKDMTGHDWHAAKINQSNPYETDPLQELVTQYGAEAVMAANEGRIPTNGEIASVRAKLEAEKVAS